METRYAVELNLKLYFYYLRFKDQTSCLVQFPDIDLVNVCALRKHRDWENSHKGVDASELSLWDWSRNIEIIEE